MAFKLVYYQVGEEICILKHQLRYLELPFEFDRAAISKIDLSPEMLQDSWHFLGPG